MGHLLRRLSRLSRFLFAATFVVGSMTALAGCSSLSSLVEKPTVTLQAVNIKEPRLDGATLAFELLVTNPNAVALEVDELAYDLQVSGKRLTSGKLENGASIPARQSSSVTIPVSVKYSELFASVLTALNNPVTPYRLEGTAKVGPFQIPFEKSGELNLRSEMRLKK